MNKFAVIGMGFIFPRHKKAIEEVEGEIILTCDIDENKKADFVDYKKMFDSPGFNDVECVVVCTPNWTHYEICRDALNKGKIVLCEKPLSISGTKGLDGVNVVLQLRYNEKVKYLKESLQFSNSNQIKIMVKTYREPKYWDSWKGDPAKSGGILYNMGIHYIDLLIHLLGNPIEIIKSKYDKYLASGKVRFERGTANYHIELTRVPGPITRKMVVNGRAYDLEGATIPLGDTGQITNLHTEVYKDFIQGKGIPLSEAKKSLNLVQELLKNGI